MEETGDGDCYFIHGNFVIRHGKKRAYKNLILCHGRVKGAIGSPVEGRIFGHAWLEHGDIFMDLSNNKKIIMRKENLYNSGRVIMDSIKRYSVDEALKMMLKHEHYGPWEEEE